MTKRVISMALCLCVVLTMLPAEALAAEWRDLTGTVPAVPQGYPEDPVYQIGYDTDIPEPETQISPYANAETVKCTLDNGAVLTVTRTGTITGVTLGSDGAITIPETIPIEGSDNGNAITVTGIGDYAFSYRYDLTGITIPDTVTTIGYGAFYGCSNLTSIAIPNSVTTIEAYAFYSCSGLTGIDIPASVTTIGYCAFSGCSKLADISIDPDNTAYTLLDGMLLSKDKSSIILCLKGKSGDITIPDSVTAIESYAFESCSSLTSITIPDSVTDIGYSAFSYCSGLTSITISKNVTTIGGYTFSYCSSLTSITIPNSVTTIGDYAFYYCSGLTIITIPNTVTTIGSQAFYGCSKLENIKIDTDNQAYITHDEMLFSKDMSSIVFCPVWKTGVISLPETVTTIGDYAFKSCNKLTRIDIPNRVTTIGNSAFSGCSGLTSINIPDSVTNIGSYAFNYCTGLTSIIIPDNVTTINYGAFSGCSGLTSITIPDGVTTIGNCAFFNCSGLTSITIPDSVTSIGTSAFDSCSGLTSIDLPDSVTDIGSYAFNYCTGLASITIPASVTTIGYCAFSGCSKLTDISIDPGNTAYTMLDEMLFSKDKSSVIFCPMWKTGVISLPETVTTIGSYAFESCSGLTSITIPDSVATISDSAFSGCSGLTSIVMPDSVTDIGSYAFNYCTGLTSIVMPDSVTTINYGAFSGCSGLTSITIPDNLTTIGDSAFYWCSGLTDITIPDRVTRIGGYAFSGCSGLTSIIVPDSVTDIGYSAFSYCSGLTNIIIPDSVTTIEDDVFNYVNPDFVLYCYSGSDAEAYAKDNRINYRVIDKSSRVLSVSVLDENESALSEGFAVTWYDENGNRVGTGASLFGAVPDKSYSFTVTLKDALAALYEQPERQTIAPADEASREIRLVKKAVAKILTLFGQVNDQTGATLSGATVTATPAEGDPVEAVTTADGTFAVTVPCGVVSVAVRKDGYYSKRETLDLTDETENSYDAGIYTLAPVQVITDRLTLSVTQRRAAEDQDMAVELPLSSLGNLEVKLTGSGGRAITNFDVQGLALLFQPGAVSANEEITITLTDPSGVYRAASASATLDGDRLGTAELTMVQKGSFVLGGVSGQDANLLVFDGAGNCIQTSAAVSGLTSGAMEPGTYQVVLLQKSELLRGVSALSYLDTFGLVSGRDYLLRQVTVADGKIIRLDNCVVPALDESRISYTIAGSTGVTSSKPSGVAVGELLMIRAAYEMDIAKGVSADSLNVVLPEGISLLEASVLINNSTAPYTYNQATREVCINMNGRDKAVVWLCCTPVKSGNHTISALMKLTNGSSQPIGAAVVLAEDARLNVPERTGKAKDLTASGKTRPGSTVTLYDNDIEVGRTTANASGSWSMSFDLAQPVYSYSYHNIYAVVAGGNLTESIATENVLVTYDKRLNVELEKITMYNTGDHGAQETVFDFTSSASTSTPYYRMWPSAYPTFTFKVEFSGDSSKLEEVYAVTTNSAGDKTYVRTTYDAASGAWVGTHNYTSFDVAPVSVTAAYSYGDMGEIPFDEEMAADIQQSFIETSKNFVSSQESSFCEKVSLTDVYVGENSIQATVIYTDPDTNIQETLGTFFTEISSIGASVTADTLVGGGYELIDTDRQIWVMCTEPGEPGMQTYIDLYNRISISLTVQASSSAEGAALFSRLSKDSNPAYTLAKWGLISVIGLSLGAIVGGSLAIYGVVAGIGWLTFEVSVGLGLIAGSLAANTLNGYAEASAFEKKSKNQVNGNIQDLNRLVANNLRLLDARCNADGSRKLSDSAYHHLFSQLEDLIVMIADYETDMNRRISNAKTACIAKTASFGALSGVSDMIMKPLEGMDLAFEMLDGNLESWTTRYIYERYLQIRNFATTLNQNINSAYQPCDDGPDYAESDDLPADMVLSTGKPATYIADPSGYVYEAVPSNRLSGVTAVISSEAGGTWNAADYDQINPQITGQDGGFYWDVPQGNWKVTLTKDGYTSTDTSSIPSAVNGWLPVPPPQLDINVGMVSANAPMVKSAVAYTNQVELAFSQYMDIASVQSAVSLTRDGTAAGGLTVRALDAEYDAAGKKQYAARFAIVPNDGNLSGSLTVSVGSGAKNYAGKPLAAGYTSPAMTAGIQPTSISGPDSVSVALHGTADVSLTLQPGIAGQTLTIESLSPALVHVGVSEVTTGMDGRASIRIRGELPGSGQIQITEPVSGLNKTITVFIGIDGTVTPQPEKPAQVKATLEDGATLASGMTLPAGSKIRLWTDTPDAVIRYTLNDTCPCLTEALVYSEPVEITEDMILRAAAWKDGVYSDTIRLELSVKSPDTPDVPDGPVSPGTPGISGSSDGSDKIPGTSHTIMVPSVSGGSVTASPQAAAPGRTVTISAVPDTGYELVFLAITDSSGKALTLTDKGSGKYTFTMPDGKVTVSAVFRPVRTQETPGSNPFTDITEGAWYYEAVRFVQENGLMSGYGNGTFAPNANLSRAMLAQILYNKEGRPTITGSAFTDVVNGAWYSDAVTWAAAQGIVAGYGNGLFGPNDNITREQLAVMLWRYAGKPAANVELSFSDTDQISGFAQTAIRWVVKNGILNGKGNNILDPKGFATRAEVAQMLKNYLDN